MNDESRDDAYQRALDESGWPPAVGQRIRYEPHPNLEKRLYHVLGHVDGQIVVKNWLRHKQRWHHECFDHCWWHVFVATGSATLEGKPQPRFENVLAVVQAEHRSGQSGGMFGPIPTDPQYSESTVTLQDNKGRETSICMHGDEFGRCLDMWDGRVRITITPEETE